MAKQHNWKDGPQSFTEMRNERVHPQHKKRGQYNDAFKDTWLLGLWYLEMVILKLCKFNGKYINRLRGFKLDKLQ